MTVVSVYRADVTAIWLRLLYPLEYHIYICKYKYEALINMRSLAFSLVVRMLQMREKSLHRIISLSQNKKITMDQSTKKTYVSICNTRAING